MIPSQFGGNGYTKRPTAQGLTGKGPGGRGDDLPSVSICFLASATNRFDICVPRRISSSCAWLISVNFLVVRAISKISIGDIPCLLPWFNLTPPETVKIGQSGYQGRKRT